MRSRPVPNAAFPPRLVPLALASAALLAMCAQFVARTDGGTPLRLQAQWTYDAVALLTAASCFLHARRRDERRVWVAVGLAILAWAAGDLYGTALLAHGRPIPHPSPADGGRLLFYPLAYVGLGLLFRKEVSGVIPSMWLDGLIAALITAAITAGVAFEAALHEAGGRTISAAALGTELAYPLGDILLLAVVVGAFALSGWRMSLRWLLFGGGILLFTAADCAYLVRTAVGSYRYGSMLDLAWPAGMMLLASAGVVPSRRLPAGRLEGNRLLVLPLLFATVGLGLEVVDHFMRLNALCIFLASAGLGVVIVRMGMTFSDYVRLLAKTRAETLTDALTGLANRRALLADLGATLESGRSHVLLLLDLNGFKSYNDRFGHPAGDALLVRLGSRLRACVDGSGRVYRLGGDEFCALLPGRGEDVPGLVRTTVASLTESGERFHIAPSVGSIVLPDDAADPPEALKLVDRRMYRQKTGARSPSPDDYGGLLGVLEARDSQLAAHTSEVADLAEAIGLELGAERVSLPTLTVVAQLHDIGKVAVPDAILLKPGPLDEEEWQIVRQHTVAGERIVGRVPGLEAVADAIRASHERWDGTGYPDGIAGHEIPLPARIVAVADAYAAMTSFDRPYRAPRAPEAALAEIVACSGTQFDPEIVAALVRVLEPASVVVGNPGG